MATEREEELINKLCDAHDEIDKLKEKIADLAKLHEEAGKIQKMHSQKIRGLSELSILRGKQLGEKDNQIAQERYAHEQTKSHLQVAKKQHLDMITEREMHDR